MTLKWLIASVIVYGAFVASVYAAQRLLQYFPERRRTAPSASDLAHAEEVVLDTADGERVIVWHAPAQRAACLCLFPRQRRFATFAGGAFS
jgi:hypothetical protein